MSQTKSNLLLTYEVITLNCSKIDLGMRCIMFEQVFPRVKWVRYLTWYNKSSQLKTTIFYPSFLWYKFLIKICRSSETL